MIKYDSYKPSGIEWLGDIPSHWDIKKIGQSFFERKEKVSDKDFAPLSVTKKGVVSQLDNAAKSNAGDDRKKVLKGDFVINSRSDRKGSSGVSPLDGSVSLISIVLEPKDLNGKYIHNLFRSYEFTEEFYRNGQGIVADLWSTKYSLMKSIYIPIPPKKEQEAIANFLDKKLEQVDNYISKQKELIKLLKEKKSSLINQAVTKGLDPKVEYKESGIEWLGKIPKHWEVKKLSRSFKNIGSGTTPSSSETKYHQNGTINWINTGDLNDSYLYQCKNKITEYAMKNTSSLKIYPKDSLIIAMYGATIGKTSISKIEACVNQACCVLSNSYEFEIKFMFYSFIGHRKYIISLSYGGGQPNISQETIKSLKFCCPPKQEQKQIVEYIEKESSKIDKVISTKEDEIKLLDEYKQSLISSAVTGKIKVS